MSRFAARGRADTAKEGGNEEVTFYLIIFPGAGHLESAPKSVQQPLCWGLRRLLAVLSGRTRVLCALSYSVEKSAGASQRQVEILPKQWNSCRGIEFKHFWE